MPTAYSCLNCGYQVSLGPFHYQDFSDGYSGQMLLFCAACGTPHSVHIALPTNFQDEMQKNTSLIIDEIGSQFNEVKRILREASGWNRPQAEAVLASLPGVFLSNLSLPEAQMILEKLKRVGAMGHIESTQGVDYKKDTLFVLIDQAWQVCAVEGDPDEMGHFELKQQSCGYCHAKGTFVTELVNSNGNTFSCPVCKKNSLTEVNQWMT